MKNNFNKKFKIKKMKFNPFSNFFVILIIILILAILFLYVQKEGFETSSQPVPGSIMVSCPEGSNSYIDRNGNTNCCRGTVSGVTCDGTTICTYGNSGYFTPFVVDGIIPVGATYSVTTTGTTTLTSWFELR